MGWEVKLLFATDPFIRHLYFRPDLKHKAMFDIKHLQAKVSLRILLHFESLW